MWFLLAPGGALGRGGGRGWGCGLSPFRLARNGSFGPAPLFAVPPPLVPLSAARADLPRPCAPAGSAPAPARRPGRAASSPSENAARRRKKHGAGKQYVQNPQGIAVNSFLFEENLQLGNRPFYDLFGLVIGCGWSCAGSERFHGLFLISLANFPLHSAFREPQPLFF